MAKIVEAPISSVAVNPYRRLRSYPYIPSKLEALEHSIKDVGLWPSVIARPLSDDRRYEFEMAFGHHRLEAARRLRLKAIPLIVQALTNKQMMQYMGRENLEDYNAAFLIQLESWEAAMKSGLCPVQDGSPRYHIEIATLLGWTEAAANGSIQLNNTARACHAVFALIDGGYNSRGDFAELTVKAAQHMAERAFARIKQIDKIGKESGRPYREIETAKRQYGRAVADTAKQVREDKITHGNIRGQVDFNATARTRADSRPSPLFAVFANAVADNLKRTLQLDSDADKLTEIVKVLNQISMLEDWEALRRLKVELFNLSERAIGWDKRLTPTKEKVVQLRALEKRGK